MKRITTLLLFFSMTGYCQTIDDKRVTTETIFTNAVGNYLKYITQMESILVDTLFIEQIDTINFNLPKVIQNTIIEVIPVSTIIIRLKEKTDPSFLQLQSWKDNKNKTDIIAFQRTCNYSNFIAEIIDEPKNYRMRYIKKQTVSWKFIKTEKGTTGCRRFYKYENGQLHFYKSVCS